MRYFRKTRSLNLYTRRKKLRPITLFILESNKNKNQLSKNIIIKYTAHIFRNNKNLQQTTSRTFILKPTIIPANSIKS